MHRNANVSARHHFWKADGVYEMEGWIEGEGGGRGAGKVEHDDDDEKLKCNSN